MVLLAGTMDGGVASTARRVLRLFHPGGCVNLKAGQETTR